jgi:hypothetical protein
VENRTIKLRQVNKEKIVTQLFKVFISINIINMTNYLIISVFCVTQRLWCSTQVDIDGNHVIGRDVWGHCETSERNCPIDIEGRLIDASNGKLFSKNVICIIEQYMMCTLIAVVRIT